MNYAYISYCKKCRVGYSTKNCPKCRQTRLKSKYGTFYGEAQPPFYPPEAQPPLHRVERRSKHMENSEWKKVENSAWNPEAGDEIEGVFVALEKDVGENHSNLYSIETAPGTTMGVWGSKVIDAHMAAVKIGQKVKIRFNGKVQPPGGKEYKSFDIFIKP